jgi:hypothetical protein
MKKRELAGGWRFKHDFGLSGAVLQLQTSNKIASEWIPAQTTPVRSFLYWRNPDGIRIIQCASETGVGIRNTPNVQQRI